MSKVVLVTGGSRGIGKGIALGYAKNGYDVVINYLGSKEKAKEAKAEINALGKNCLLVQADVSKSEDVTRLVEETLKEFNQIDVLVNNSGITRDGLFLRMSEQDFDEVIDINLKGTFNCCKAVSRVMMKQKFGSIINMSSVVGLVGNIGQANYAASKAGVIGLTKALAKELAGYNIRVNAIAPGFISTDMTDKLSDKIKERVIADIPLKRFGKVEDVAKLACFLGSDDSSYISGQVINVDGGMVV